MTKGRWIGYQPEELAWIEARKDWTRRDLHRAFCAFWQRSDVSFDNFKALCSRNGWLTGRSGCFPKGNVSFNKGKKGLCAPGSEKGWFKKGQLPKNTKWLGHERLSKDGYVEVSVAETNPHTGFGRRYVEKHRWLWEKLHGPVPEGMCLKSIDGNRANSDPANWELLPRGMLPRLNGIYGRDYDAAPAELKPTIMAIAKLAHQAAAAKKSAKEPAQ